MNPAKKAVLMSIMDNAIQKAEQEKNSRMKQKYYAIVDCTGKMAMDRIWFPTGSVSFYRVSESRNEQDVEASRLNEYEDVDNRPLRVVEFEI